MNKCSVKDCPYSTKQKSHLKRHLWEVHDIGEGKIFKCSVKDCPFTSKGDLKRHLWEVHDIGEGKIFKCSVKDCAYSTKRKSHLKQHLWQVHDIGEGKIFKCSVKDCPFTSKNKGDLKRHLWQVHDIGEGKIFKCSVKDCASTFKRKSHLKQHLWQVHDIGEGKIFKCSVKDCPYSTKDKGNLKQHLSGFHDIGEKQCEYCYSNVNSLTSFTDPKTKITNDICRKCYKTSAGYSSRIEKETVEFLKKNDRISPYIVLEDKILKGNKCNTKRRPDLLLSSSSEHYMVVEIDENQHQGYDKRCEEGRMNEILDEIPDGYVSIVRWNPHKYKTEGKQKNKKERMEILFNLIIKISEMGLKNDKDLIRVYYCFYDKDNEIICNSWNRKFIYDLKDI